MDRRIVAGVDGSAASEQVLRWADAQAALTGAELVALMATDVDIADIADDAVPNGGDLPPEQRLLPVLSATVASALPPDRAALVKTQTSLRTPADALIIASGHADLVVVGPHGRGRINELLLGSTADEVASRAACPVAVVHGLRHPLTHRIVVGIDGSACARRALAWALGQAERTNSHVDAIGVWDWRPMYTVTPHGPSDATPKDWAEQLLAEALEQLSAEQAARVSVHVREGNDAVELVAAGDAADLIVLGRHGSGGRTWGSVSQKVARRANVPVVLVHGHDRDATDQAAT